MIAQRIADAGGQIRCVAGAPDDWTTPEGELQVGMMVLIASTSGARSPKRGRKRESARCATASR